MPVLFPPASLELSVYPKPETAETADAVQTADDVAANEKPASAEAQQVFTADDMAEDGDAMEDAKAQIYGRSKRGRQ